jgi:hypothetical protein
MMREALNHKVDFNVWTISTPHLERFAALVAAAERESACRIVTGLCISDNNAHEINTAIRARGQA